MSDDEQSIPDREIEIIEESELTAERTNPEEQANNQEGQDATQKQEVKVKKVRNPQPKLNADRLKGPRGIQTLEGIFEKVKFKGRGHEESDLKTLLKGYEYWCHRLFPRFRFDDCVDKIERLGSNKVVQTHIKKIRMNMLFLDEPNNSGLNDDVNEVADGDTNENELESQDDRFTGLLGTQVTSTNTQDDELSEEQLQRIQENRELAIKRRQELLLQKNKDCTQTQSQENLGGPIEEYSPKGFSQNAEEFHTENNFEIIPDESEDLIVNEVTSEVSSSEKNLSQMQEIEGMDLD